MKDEEITIRVDPEAARIYRSASDELRMKLDLLLSLRLKDAVRSDQSLAAFMQGVGRKAQERGMTPEILKSLLND